MGGWGTEPWGTFPWGGGAAGQVKQPENCLWLIDLYFQKRGHVRVSNRAVTLVPSVNWAGVSLGLGGATATWLLNEDSGSAMDAGRLNLDLAQTGSVTRGAAGPLGPSWLSGNASTTFPGGSSNYFSGGPGGLTDPHKADFSVEAWVRANANPGGGTQYTAFYRTGSGAQLVTLHLNSTPTLVFRYDDAASATGTAQSNVSNVANGDWHHIVGVREAGSRRALLYLDTVLLSAVAETGSPPLDIDVSQNYYVGGANFANSCWNGDLYGVSWYDRVLTPGEIYRNYWEGMQGPSQRFLPTELRNR